MSDKKKGAKRLLNGLNERIEMPGGFLSGGIHIEMNSNREMIIDGKCSILEYAEEQITMNTQSGVLKISGAGLDIISLARCSAVIVGKIFTVEFCD